MAKIAMNKKYLTAHELAKELMKFPEDTVVCFNNGKGLYESVKSVNQMGSETSILINGNPGQKPAKLKTRVALNLKQKIGNQI